MFFSLFPSSIKKIKNNNRTVKKYLKNIELYFYTCFSCLINERLGSIAYIGKYEYIKAV